MTGIPTVLEHAARIEVVLPSLKIAFNRNTNPTRKRVSKLLVPRQFWLDRNEGSKVMTKAKTEVMVANLYHHCHMSGKEALGYVSL